MSRRTSKTIVGDDGAKLGEAEYIGDKLDGACQLWHANGRIQEQSYYEDGKLHGDYRTWWPNGKRKESGRYHAGQKVGRYTWYLEDGTVCKEYDFDVGDDR